MSSSYIQLLLSRYVADVVYIFLSFGQIACLFDFLIDTFFICKFPKFVPVW